MTKTTDEIIDMISETLREADDAFILHIANSVLTEHVDYVGDSLFEIQNLNDY